MDVKALYLDFFEFLNRLPEGDPWPSYQRLYLEPNDRFFAAYQKTFDHLDREQLAGRVRQIKAGDYGQLRSLLHILDPAKMAEEALLRCCATLPFDPEPPVYLFVGFFSADGFTVEVDGIPSIALGLERCKDFKDIPLLVAHEYCHCAQHRFLKNLFPEGERSLQQTMIREGLSVLFTETVYPEISLHRHLFLTPERWEWSRQNQDALLELAGADLLSEKLIPVLFGPGDPKAGLPPRLGSFVARQMVRHCLIHHGGEEFGESFPGFEGFLRRVAGKNPPPGSGEGA